MQLIVPGQINLLAPNTTIESARAGEWSRPKKDSPIISGDGVGALVGLRPNTERRRGCELDGGRRRACRGQSHRERRQGGVGSIVRGRSDATASDPGSKDFRVHAERVIWAALLRGPVGVPGVTVSIAAEFTLLAVRGSSHRPDFDDVGHEVPQQILDAVLQRSGR